LWAIIGRDEGLFDEGGFFLEFTLDVTGHFDAIDIQQGTAEGVEKKAMGFHDACENQLAVGRGGAEGSQVIFIMDADLSEPPGTAWAEVAELHNGARHGDRNLP
jgi:hypothetical protein